MENSLFVGSKRRIGKKRGENGKEGIFLYFFEGGYQKVLT
jgi:hypothetical protein